MNKPTNKREKNDQSSEDLQSIKVPKIENYLDESNDYGNLDQLAVSSASLKGSRRKKYQELDEKDICKDLCEDDQQSVNRIGLGEEVNSIRPSIEIDPLRVIECCLLGTSSEDMAPLEVIRNNKGGEKLCHCGYMYTKKSASSTIQRWECSRRSAFSCNGKVTTNLEITHTISTIPHNHVAENSAVNASKIRNLIRDRAMTEPLPTGQIIADCITGLNDREIIAVGRLSSIARNIQRQRNSSKNPELRNENNWKATREQYRKPFLINRK